MNLSARMVREVDLYEVVSHCVDQTLCMNQNYGFMSNREMRDYFEWMLSEEISSEGDLKAEYGLTSRLLGMFQVKVTQCYRSPDQKKQSISVEIKKEALPFGSADYTPTDSEVQ